MIEIGYKIENSKMIFERELTEEEEKTVTSKAMNGSTCIYYQGDEKVVLKPEPVEQKENAYIDEILDNLDQAQLEKLKTKLGIN